MIVSFFDMDYGINLEFEDIRSDGINILVLEIIVFLFSFFIFIIMVNYDVFEVI